MSKNPSNFKPTYLMTLEEYQEKVVPLLKEYNKFLKKNSKHLLSTGYGSIYFYTFPELLEDLKNNNVKGTIKRGEYDSGYSDLEYARREFSYSNTGKFNKDYHVEEVPAELIEKKAEFVKKINQFISEDNMVNNFDSNNEFKTNKPAIKRAIDNGTYKDLLEKGEISISELEKIANSVGVKLPKKIFSADTIKDKESKALYEKIYGLMPSINKDTLSGLVENIKQSFKPLEKIIYDKETERYHKAIKETLEAGKAEIESLSEWLNFYYSVFDYEKEEKKEVKVKDHRGREFYQKEKWIVGLSLKPNWKEAVHNSVLTEVEMLKVKMIYSIISNFEKITLPIKEINKIHLDVGYKGFEGSYRFIFSDGSSFVFSTEAIGAGGYNIQRYHFRYLAKFTDAQLADGTKLTGGHAIIDYFSSKEKKDPFTEIAKAQNKMDIITIVYNYLKTKPYKFNYIKIYSDNVGNGVSFRDVATRNRTKYFNILKNASLEEAKQKATDFFNTQNLNY